jgi:hypothetical protein
MSFDGPARNVQMSEEDARAEAEAGRKIDICNAILGKIAVACLLVISLQGALLLPITVIRYGWA